MAYMFIRVTVPSLTTTQLNSKLDGSTKPHEGLNKLEVLMCAIEGGALNAQVDCYVSNTDETLTAQNGGSSASYVLL